MVLRYPFQHATGENDVKPLTNSHFGHPLQGKKRRRKEWGDVTGWEGETDSLMKWWHTKLMHFLCHFDKMPINQSLSEVYLDSLHPGSHHPSHFPSSLCLFFLSLLNGSRALKTTSQSSYFSHLFHVSSHLQFPNFWIFLFCFVFLIWTASHSYSLPFCLSFPLPLSLLRVLFSCA